MPEMPEVETIVCGLRQRIIGERIHDIQVYWPRSLANCSADAFRRALVGGRVRSARRRGKYIILGVARWFVVIHLRMTGQLLVYDRCGQRLNVPRHVRFSFRFDYGSCLHFRDMRKFGRCYLVDCPEEIVGDIGPEPLDGSFTTATLSDILRNRRRQLKAALLDQRVLAGLGNIYVDESLWRAGIHPLRHTHELTDGEVANLYDAMCYTLRTAVANGGTTVRDYRDSSGVFGSHQGALAVYQRHGQPCPACGATIRKLRVAGRGTHVCPECQRSEV